MFDSNIAVFVGKISKSNIFEANFSESDGKNEPNMVNWSRKNGVI